MFTALYLYALAYAVLRLELGLTSLRRGLALKEALRRSLESRLSPESRRRALGDGHARRKPRPCGLTIHTCVGCPYACLYCYIDDLGFPRGKAHAYSLTGEEWLLSLASNPFFLPGLQGTYLSFGSVCEPLHPTCISTTLEYLSQARSYLLNPCQVATKSTLSDEAVGKLLESSPPVLNVLVTIVTLRRSELLEPKAPSPQARLEALSRLSRRGIPSFLFLRPTLPGLEEEVDELLEEAKRAGAMGVVVGGLRLSEGLARRLRSAGLKVPPLKASHGKLVDVAQRELKDLVVKTARAKGLPPFRSACCATTYSLFKLTGVKLACAGLCFTSQLCTRCPVGCASALPKLDEEEALESASMALGLRPRSVRVEGGRVEVEVDARSLRRGGVELLQVALRRRVKILAGRPPPRS